MDNRPFELDDLVISKNGTGIVTGLVANKRAVSCEFGENTSYYSLKTGKECQFSSAIDWDDGDEIKHIRTPRKGSKEARDIVAMLCNEYRRVMLRRLHDAECDGEYELKVFWRDFKSGMLFHNLSHRILYDLAKYMLK